MYDDEQCILIFNKMLIYLKTDLLQDIKKHIKNLVNNHVQDVF